MRVEEKLATLQQHLKGNCKSLAQMSGGGEEEYKEVLRKLKKTCGRKDNMRIGHMHALKLLNPKKGNAESLKKFAAEASSHLFNLSRLGVDAGGDIIGMMCQKLSHAERREWNLGRGGEIETRGLNVFGDWLTEIATSYSIFYELLEEQDERQYRARIHETTSSENNLRSSYEKKSQCPKCQQQHALSDCSEFKRLSVSKRKEFLKEDRLCFGCFKFDNEFYRVGKQGRI